MARSVHATYCRIRAANSLRDRAKIAVPVGRKPLCKSPSRRLQKRDRLGLGVVKDGCRQWPAEDGAGIEVQPIAAQVSRAGHHRRVAVNDQPAVVAAIRQERFPDPEQVEFSLRVERLVRVDAGMDERDAGRRCIPQKDVGPVEERSGGSSRARGDAVALQRRRSALQPQPPLRSGMTSSMTASTIISWLPISAMTRSAFCPEGRLSSARRRRLSGPLSM